VVVVENKRGNNWCIESRRTTVTKK